MMDLKTFVEETLCQIAEGIQGAQGRLEGGGATINPYYHIEPDGNLVPVSPPNSMVYKGKHFQRVHFDIAVTAAEKDSSGGGFSVAVVMAKLGAGTQNELSSTTVSRVQFEVVVDLPHQKPE